MGINTPKKNRIDETTADQTLIVGLAGLKQALLVAFAGQIDALADFGLTPRKVHVFTPEQRIAAAAKSRATRAARHTMGSKQKVIAGRWDPAPMALHVVA
jgi:hypothetical protein